MTDRVKIPPKNTSKKFKHGEARDEDARISGAKIGAESANFGVDSEKIDTIRKGTVFMDLCILLAVFDAILKCPDCGDDVNSHVDVRKKHGYSHYIVLQCVGCEWRYCFNTSKSKASHMK